VKKKTPAPAPAPQKAPDPAAKQPAPPETAPTQAAGDKPVAEATPAPDEGGTDLSDVPVQSADAKLDLTPKDTGPAPMTFTTPLGPKDPIDWFGMRQPFLNRGLPLTGRDADQIQTNWTFTYNNLLRWGFTPELSVKIANIGTPVAYDFALSRDHPTQIEKFDMETEKMLPPGQKLGKIVVPIITPDTLSWTVEKITGKKVDFRF
jgi:hypothetical protein